MTTEEATKKSTSESRRQKLFVGGLHRETSDETLKAYFEKYGELTDSVVIRDMGSKESRGFGYVTFDDYRVTKTVLKDKRDTGPHRIDDKEVEVKRAIPRDDDSNTSKTKTTKVFIGGLPDGANEEDIKSAVETALEAEIVKVDLIQKKNEQGETIGHRGFCFVQLDNHDDADELCCIKKVEIKGKLVEMRKAEPKGSEGGSGGGRSRFSGRGGYPNRGRGGGRGGSGGGDGSSYHQSSGGFGGGSYGGGGYGSGYESQYGFGGFGGGGGGGYQYSGGNSYYDGYDMGLYSQNSYYPPSGGGGGASRGRGRPRYQPY